jgi:fatty acid desaturase
MRERNHHGRFIADIGLVSGSLLIFAASFLPWAYTGRRGRNAFEVVAIAQRFKVVPNDGLELVARVFFVLPAVSAAVLAAVALGQRRTARLFAAVEVLAISALSIQVLRSPFRSGVAPWWALLGVGVVCVGAVTGVVTGPTPATASGEAQ